MNNGATKERRTNGETLYVLLRFVSVASLLRCLTVHSAHFVSDTDVKSALAASMR
jgi:hypothetical protein